MDFSNNPAGIPPLAFTHGGRFHADDVFSAALLKILRPDIRIYRGYEIPKGFSGIVFDIGDGKYDHHTTPLLRRENGSPYAAFGLLWKDFGKFFLGEEEAKRFDEKFVQPLDYDDNNGSGNVLAGVIGAFNPVWDSTQNPDEAFEEAITVAGRVLHHKLEGLMALERANVAIQKYLKDMQGTVLILPDYIPWKPVLVPSEAEFVIFPSMRGGYTVQCVPKDFNPKSLNKVPMPNAWRGQPQQQLAEVSGISDIRFCHASGFMVTTESLESAKKVCELAKNEFDMRMEQSRADREKNAAQPATGAADNKQVK